MTSSNRFTYDVIANDKASEVNQKITASIQALVPALEAAASAYERMAASQAKLGIKNIGAGQAGAMKEMGRASADAARVERDAEREREAAAKRSLGAVSERSKVIAASSKQELDAIRMLNAETDRRTAQFNRQTALQQSSSGQRIAALQAEIARTQQLVALRKQEVAAAQASYNQSKTARTGGTLGLSEMSAQSSTAKVTALRQAHQSLAAAESETARASRLLTTEMVAQNRALGENVQQLKSNEVQYNTVRYALYQVSAAYAAVARASASALTDVMKTSIAMQSAFAQVARTTNLGQEARNPIASMADQAQGKLAVLETSLKELSKTIPTTFEDLSKVGALGAQLGIASSDVAKFAEVVTKFAATTNVTAEQSAQYFGRLQNILGVPTTKFQNLASAVASLGTSSVATEDEILAVTTQIGAMGNNSGLSAQYVIGLGTALASVRVAPELARGVTTKVFSDITRAAAEGGPTLDAYAKVLGTTSEKAAALWEQNPEQFFSQFITSLGKTSEAGTNLVPILDALGIVGRRDAPVITRLASSYQLLGDYVGQSYSSFQQGTYLDESFQTIAVTAQAALTEMANSFALLKDSIGSAFLTPLKEVANVLNGFFTNLAKIPAFLTGPLVGVVAAGAVFVGLRAALTLTAAAIFAFRAAGRQMETGAINTRNVVRLLTQAIIENGGVAKAATASIGGQAGAINLLGGAATRAVPPVAGLAGSMGGVALAGAPATAGLRTTASGIILVGATAPPATVAVTGFAASLRALAIAIGPVGWITLGIGLAIGAWAGISASVNKADEDLVKARADQEALNKTWQNAGDGADALAKAIAADTAEYEKVGASGAKAAGIYATITKEQQKFADGTTRLVGTVNDLRTGMTRSSEGPLQAADNFAQYSEALAKATSQTDPAAAGIQNVNNALIDQNIALGQATEEWKKKALFDQIMAELSRPELRTAFLELGNKIPQAIQIGLEHGAQGVTDFFASTTNTIQTRMAELQNIISQSKVVDPNNAGFGVVVDPGQVAAAEAEFKKLSDLWTVIGTLAKQFADADTAVEAAAIWQQNSKVIGEALGGVETDMTDVGTKAEETAKKLQDLATAFEESVQRMFSASDLTGGLVDSFEKLGQSIADNGKEFNNFSEGGRANLAALEDSVNAFAAIQSAAIQDGSLTAEQAAANLRGFMQDLYATLAAQGIDTSQLDWLQQKLNVLVGGTYQTTVQVDTHQAMQNIAVVQSALNTLKASNPGMWGSQVAPTGATVSTSQIPVRPTAGSPTSNMLAQSLANARAIQNAKNLADANKKAASAAKKAGTAQKNAADQASEALKKQQEYVRDLANFYESLGSKAFAMVKAEGNAFKSLQELGQSLVDNGKSFNTVTELGRKNFDALSSVFDDFGKTLGNQIEGGVLTAAQGAAQYREFARGVYGELISLGVSAQGLSGFFRALGVDASGWTGSTQSVQQYAWFITAGAEAAGGLTDNLKEAEEYADKLGTALDKAFDRYFGLANAIDSVQSAMNDLKQAYQDSIDKVVELRRENEKLSADLGSAQADKRKAEIERDISIKYGESDRMVDYTSQVADAQSRIDDAQAQIDANKKEADALEVGRNALEGYSSAAIENRSALQDLQNQMLDQIKAYAATGVSTDQVVAYTEQLRSQFTLTANQAGFTNAQITGYTAAFNLYAAAIRSVPNSLQVTATANTSAAMSALNAIPRGMTHVTTATIDGTQYNYVTRTLSLIPTQGQYLVTPRIDPGSLGAASNVLNGIGAGLPAIPVKVRLTDAMISAMIHAADPAGLSFDTLNRMAHGLFKGGPIKGFADGGYLPGTPPDPNRDNLMARGPGGMYGLQSGEFVVQRAIVNKLGVPFFDKLNSGMLPGFARGGGVGTTGGGNGGIVIAELSPTDRALLTRIANNGNDLALYSDGEKIATSVQTGNARLTRRGRG